MRILFTALCCFMLAGIARGQNAAPAANAFLNTLDSAQKLRTLFPFDIDDRYNFHFFPIDDHKGIMVNDLNAAQKQAAFDLIKVCLSPEAVEKIKAIMQLDGILKVLEHRAADDHFRDTGKYYFTVYGIPANNTVWGWRLEGHHVTFTFSSEKGELVSGTPGFLGANPAVVQDGPNKGEQVLKDETNMGFILLHSLTPEQLKATVIDTTAPGDIVTYVKRKVMLLNPPGINYTLLTPQQQQQLLQIVRLYVNRYTRLFANKMLKNIEKAGLNNLTFAWAGAMQPGIGHPHYYRIQGPTFIIEYDNTQGNGNHVHSVMRDLQNDFGGDLLLQHYKAEH